MDIKKITFLLILFILFCFQIHAQDKTQTSFLNRSFQGINLGISREEFDKLIQEKNMTIQGELDIYFNEPDKSVVAILYPPYFRKILFVFFKNQLVMIIFFFDPSYISIYEEYIRLFNKYGEPIVNQKQFIWEDLNTILILEKDPFIVKLIDKEFFIQLEKQREQIENMIQNSLDNSLDTL